MKTNPGAEFVVFIAKCILLGFVVFFVVRAATVAVSEIQPNNGDTLGAAALRLIKNW